MECGEDSRLNAAGDSWSFVYHSGDAFHFMTGYRGENYKYMLFISSCPGFSTVTQFWKEISYSTIGLLKFSFYMFKFMKQRVEPHLAVQALKAENRLACWSSLSKETCGVTWEDWAQDSPGCSVCCAFWGSLLPPGSLLVIQESRMDKSCLKKFGRWALYANVFFKKKQNRPRNNNKN